jgi:hypothetical protein
MECVNAQNNLNNSKTKKNTDRSSSIKRKGKSEEVRLSKLLAGICPHRYFKVIPRVVHCSFKASIV